MYLSLTRVIIMVSVALAEQAYQAVTNFFLMRLWNWLTNDCCKLNMAADRCFIRMIKAPL